MHPPVKEHTHEHPLPHSRIVQAAHNKHKTASILRNANGDLRTRTPPSQDSRGLLRHGRRQQHIAVPRP